MSDTTEAPRADVVEMSCTTQSMDTHSDTTLADYTVEGQDTLTSVAAKFDCLPTELMKLNRMSTRLVFPGQKLTVPRRIKHEPTTDNNDVVLGDQAVSGAGSLTSGHSAITSESRCAAGASIAGASAGDCGTCPMSCSSSLAGGGGEAGVAPPPSTSAASSVAPIKYIKIKSRHITDGQGVVSGTLLATANCLMFDPNVSDPLVLEHGADNYGVIVPLDNVVSAALYSDIAHMRVKHGGDVPLPELPTPEVYTPLRADDMFREARERSNTSLSSPPPGADTLRCPVASSCQQSSSGRSEPPSPPNTPHTTPTKSPSPFVALSSAGGGGGGGVLGRSFSARHASSASGRSRFSSDGSSSSSRASFTSAEHRCGPGMDDDSATAGTGKKHKVWPRLSHPLTWMESLSGSQEKDTATSNLSCSSSTSSTTLAAAAMSGSTSGSCSSQDSVPRSMLSNVVSSVSSMSNAIVSSPRYIADLGSGIFNSLSPADSGSTDASNNSKFSDTRSDNRPRAHSAFTGYKNLVTLDEKPSLFASLENLLPSPLRESDDPPLYLCIVMGKRAGKKIRKTVRIVTYGERKLRSELWFAIPREKCDPLYHFFQHWAPEVYGSLATTKPQDRGFELVDSDTEIWQEDEPWSIVDHPSTSSGSTLIDIPKQIPKQSWEAIKAPYVKLYSLIRNHTSTSSDGDLDEGNEMCEELRRALDTSMSMTSMDMEFIPELIGNSEVLSDSIRKSLTKVLPPRVEGYPWTLVFSSSEHGFSLKSLYRKSSVYESPMLLVVQDTNDHVFGAVTSCAIQMSEHYYGTGETFLFACQPSFCVYRWSGENSYYIRGTADGLEFGSGDGHYGLFLDSDLYRGSSQCCATFNNQPLTPHQDFVVKAIELWGLT